MGGLVRRECGGFMKIILYIVANKNARTRYPGILTADQAIQALREPVLDG
jgi:hypothetical protein